MYQCIPKEGPYHEAIQWHGEIKDLYPWMEKDGGFLPFKYVEKTVIVESNDKRTVAKPNDMIVRSPLLYYEAMTVADFQRRYHII